MLILWCIRCRSRLCPLQPDLLRDFILHHRHIPRRPKSPHNWYCYLARKYRSHFCYILLTIQIIQFAELSNLKTHLTLRNLRPAGTRQRAIPYGYGFNLVSCPNYFFEAISWGVIAVLSGSWAGGSCVLLSVSAIAVTNAFDLLAYGFLALSTYQMAIWADKKHRTYKKEFGKDYPRGRKAMFPFLY